MVRFARGSTGSSALNLFSTASRNAPFRYSRAARTLRRSAAIRFAAAILLLLLSSTSYADDAIIVRVAWGGGAEKMWEGTIAVNHGTISQPHPLGIEADEPGSMWLDSGRLVVRQRSPRNYDGVDLVVTAPADARLIVQLTAAGDASVSGTPSVPDKIEIPLTDLSSDFYNRELDKQDNRLLVRRAQGDTLLFRTARSSLVFSPGETLHGEVAPHLLPFATEGAVQIRTQLLDAQQRPRWSSMADTRGGAEKVPLDLTLPEDEGVYDLVITAQQKADWPRGLRNSLRWKRPVVERRVQLIVIARQPPRVKAAAGVKGDSPIFDDPLRGYPAKIGTVPQVLEIDPTSSRWWEKIKLPQWSQFSRGWPGPLGNGMRETIHHTLGDLSQLKPNAADPLRGCPADVSWEAYALSITNPGRPHVLEVDYPSDVPQTLGISILEINAAGTLVPLGLDSGVDVSEEAASAAEPHWEHHRLVFWPRTNAPLVLITNRRQHSPAVYGKIRVQAGGEHLGEPDTSASRSGPILKPEAQARKDGISLAGASGFNVGQGSPSNFRLFMAYMDRPLLPENFSAEEVLDTWSGRTLQDWRTFHQAGTRLIEYLRYAGYNGLMLTVAADGSAIYPSQVLEPTPRYDTGVFFASGQDPQPKDVLEMLLRLMDREALQMIPSIEFATPLPALEAIRRRGGKEAEGLEWIGADGNTWCQTYAGRRGLAPYYNTLDPRVQEAMLAAVREAGCALLKPSEFSRIGVAAVGLRLRATAQRGVGHGRPHDCPFRERLWH